MVSCEPQFPRLSSRRKGAAPHRLEEALRAWLSHTPLLVVTLPPVHVNRMIAGLITSSLWVLPRHLFLSVLLVLLFRGLELKCCLVSCDVPHGEDTCVRKASFKYQ